MSLSEKVHQLNQQIGGALERALSELRREASEAAERLRTSTDEAVRRLESYTPDLPSSFLRDEDLEPEVAAAARSAAESAAAAAGRRTRRTAFGELRDALDGIDRARSQAEILNALLQGTSRFSSRAALLLLRGSEMRGWGSRGFGDGEAVRQLAIPVPAGTDGAWARLAAGQGGARLSGAEAAELSSRAESAVPERAVVVPLVLRDRVAAAVYADRVAGSETAELSVEAIQVLTYVAALAIESLPFRERASTSTLQIEPGAEEEEETPAASTASVAAAAPAAVAPVAPMPPEPPEAPEPPAPEPAESLYLESPAAEPAPEPAARESVPEPYSEPAPVEALDEPEPAEPEISWTVESEEEVVTADEAAPVYAAEPEPAAAPESYGGGLPSYEPAYEEERPAAPMAAMAPVTAFPTQEVPAGAFGAPAPEPAPEPAAAQETVLLPRPAFGEDASEPAPPPLRPVPAPEPMPVPAAPAPAPAAGSSFDALRTTPLGGGTPLPVSGSPEVAPPSDVQGPGWAFATTRVPVSPNEESLHEEARRLARLLVSEIKLYNEEQVDEGRRNRDLYERLKEDIDRSRQMYEERVEPRILKSTDYFYQELVRILAAGDSKALGI